VGNFPYLHGVGCRDNFITTPTGFPQAFGGLRTATLGGSGVYRSPGFTNSLTGNALVAGPGVGNYRPAMGSPLLGANPDPLISHDIDGRARPLVADNIGAYAPA
jgi:hypothetical protein